MCPWLCSSEPPLSGLRSTRPNCPPADSWSQYSLKVGPEKRTARYPTASSCPDNGKGLVRHSRPRLGDVKNNDLRKIVPVSEAWPHCVLEEYHSAKRLLHPGKDYSAFSIACADYKTSVLY